LRRNVGRLLGKLLDNVIKLGEMQKNFREISKKQFSKMPHFSNKKNAGKIKIQNFEKIQINLEEIYQNFWKYRTNYENFRKTKKN